MIQFDLPWLFLVLPLPLVVYYLAPPVFDQSKALQAPFINRLAVDHEHLLEPKRGTKIRYLWQQCLITLLWCGLLVAAAKPVYLLPPIEIKTPSRDIMFMLDLSASMAEADVVFSEIDQNLGQNLEPDTRLSRLVAAKQLLTDLVRQRQGDQLALAVFANAAYLIQPFSVDKALFVNLLDDIDVGMAGTKTMLGDAIAFAFLQFDKARQTSFATGSPDSRDTQVKQRVLILLTDGNDSGSLIPPTEAAALARSIGLKIYPILLGDSATGADIDSQNSVDEAALILLAETTGGKFFRATNSAEIRNITQLLDQLAPHAFNISYYQQSQDLYYWSLLFVLVVALVAHFVAALKRTSAANSRGLSNGL